MKIRFVVAFIGGILFANACFADIASTTYHTGGNGIDVANDGTITNTAVSKVRSGGESSTTLVNVWLE